MKAIMIVSFGSSVPAARACIERVEKYISSKHPDRDLFSSYTSSFIRKKINASGENIKSLDEILKYLKEKGYTDVLIQPTHIIPGLEFDKLKILAKQWEESFDRLSLGKTLISDAKDIIEVSRVLYQELEVAADEAVLLMGHGTEHISNFIYPALETAFRTQGHENVYVATVEGWPALSDAIEQMKKAGVHKLLLAPFLLIAGDHVLNDMIGNDDSWLKQIQAQGFEVRYSDKGLCEYDEILSVYSSHIL